MYFRPFLYLSDVYFCVFVLRVNMGVFECFPSILVMFMVQKPAVVGAFGVTMVGGVVVSMVGAIGVYGGVGAAALLLPTYLGRVALEAQDQGMSSPRLLTCVPARAAAIIDLTIIRSTKLDDEER